MREHASVPLVANGSINSLADVDMVHHVCERESVPVCDRAGVYVRVCVCQQLGRRGYGTRNTQTHIHMYRILYIYTYVFFPYV